MKSQRTIQRELAKVEKTLHTLPGNRALTPGEELAEQYGAMQALRWALGEENTAAPHKLAGAED